MIFLILWEISFICSPLRSVASKLNTIKQELLVHGVEQVTKTWHTEAGHPRECDIEVYGDMFIPYFVNFDVCVEIDRAVVDEFNDCQEEDDCDGNEGH